jgi:hypothetical protein
VARRPLAFGIRYRDKGRTVRVRADRGDPGKYVLEISRRGAEPQRQKHDSLTGALAGFASAWRERLH